MHLLKTEFNLGYMILDLRDASFYSYCSAGKQLSFLLHYCDFIMVPTTRKLFPKQV